MENIKKTGLSVVSLAILVWIILNLPLHFKTDLFRWLYELSLFSTGAELYKDFTWQYPPLSLIILKYLSPSFEVNLFTVHLSLVLISLLILTVLFKTLTLKINKFDSVFLLLAISVISQTSDHFRMLSVQVYTPAILTGYLGLSLVLYAVVAKTVDSPKSNEIRQSYQNSLIIMCGLFISVLSKPELGLGAVAIIFTSMFATKDYWNNIRIVIFTTVLVIIWHMFYFNNTEVSDILNGYTGFGAGKGQVNEIPSLKIILIHIIIAVSYFYVFVSKTKVLALLGLIGWLFGFIVISIFKPQYCELFIKAFNSSTLYFLILVLAHQATKFHQLKSQQKYMLIIGVGIIFVNIRNVIWINNFSFFIGVISVYLTLFIFSLQDKKYINNWWKVVGFLFLINIVYLIPKTLNNPILKTEKGNVVISRSDYNIHSSVISFINDYTAANNDDFVLLTAPYGGLYEFIFDKSLRMKQTQFVRVGLSKSERLNDISKLVESEKNILHIKQLYPKNPALNNEAFHHSVPEMYEILLNNGTELARFENENEVVSVNLITKLKIKN